MHPCPAAQAARGHERRAGLRSLAPRYLALLAERLAAAPADMEALPRVYAALDAAPASSLYPSLTSSGERYFLK